MTLIRSILMAFYIGAGIVITLKALAVGIALYEARRVKRRVLG